MIITKYINVQVDISIVELSELFWDMSDEQQANFFNKLGDIAKYNSPFFEKQLQNVMTHPDLDEYGRYVMSIIGEYSGANE